MNVRWIDFTIWLQDDNGSYDHVGIRTKINDCRLFKKWAYGVETAPTTGRLHMQCRGELKAALGPEVLAVLSGYLNCRHVSPTHVRDFEYIYKDGDFYESWLTFREVFLTAELSPWQQALADLSYDDRQIEFVYDPSGAAGKTFFGRCMEARRSAVYIPPVTSARDMMAAILHERCLGWYIVDCPASFEWTRDWMTGLEQIKNGYIFETRYKFEKVDLGCNPRVTVLCNALPPKHLKLSKDRVRVLTIEPDEHMIDRLIERKDLQPVLDYHVEYVEE